MEKHYNDFNRFWNVLPFFTPGTTGLKGIRLFWESNETFTLRIKGCWRRDAIEKQIDTGVHFRKKAASGELISNHVKINI